MGIEELIKEINTLKNERLDKPDESGRIEKEIGEKFQALVKVSHGEGVVALVNGSERVILLGIQIVSELNPSYGYYIRCLGTGSAYSIDADGKITEINLLSSGRFSSATERGYRHYSMLATPEIEDLRMLLRYQNLDPFLRDRINKKIQQQDSTPQ